MNENPVKPGQRIYELGYQNEPECRYLVALSFRPTIEQVQQYLASQGWGDDETFEGLRSDVLIADASINSSQSFIDALDEAPDCPRMGRVCIPHGYVVDMDNEDMVEHAKDALFEDIFSSAVKFGEENLYIKLIEAPGASPDEIPEFIQEILEDEADHA